MLAGFGTCISSLFAFSCSLSGPTALAFEIISGLITGACSALLLLQWAAAYARMDNVSAIINTSLSLPFTVLVYVLVIRQAPFPFAGIIASCLPLFELALLLPILKDMQAQKEAQVKQNASYVSPLLLFAHLGIPLFFYGFAIGFLRATSFSPPDAADYIYLTLFSAATLACTISSSLTLSLSTRDRNSWGVLFKATMMITFIALIFSPGIFVGSVQFGMFIVSLGYFCIGPFMWSFLAVISRNYHLSPFAVFGMGRGCMALASVLVDIAPALFDLSSTPFLDGSYAYIALVLICLLMGFILIPSPKTLSNLLGETSSAHDANHDKHADTGLSDDVRDKSEPLYENSLEDAPSSRMDPTNSASARLEVPLSKTSQSGATIAEIVAQGPLTEVKSQTVDMDTLSKHCELVSNHYMLSQRETEVLFLLALGRNSTYIQKTLYISEGTAKTHIRHIYRKTGVHKQQDLIELVERGTY